MLSTISIGIKTPSPFPAKGAKKQNEPKLKHNHKIEFNPILFRTVGVALASLISNYDRYLHDQ
jgi:hypothetical protein